MGSLSPSTARRESCDSKQSPSAQLFVPQRLDHLKPNGAAGGKNGGADRDCHGRDETAQDMPYSVRCPAALLAPTLQVIHRVIATFLIKQSGLKPRQANMGAVMLIQRFGSAANLNIHLHCLVLDGVYLNCDGAAIFHEAAAPSTDELARGCAPQNHHAHHAPIDAPGRSHRRTEADLPRRNRHRWRPEGSASRLVHLSYRPRPTRRPESASLQSLPSAVTTSAPELRVNAHGFSLHAAVRWRADQRKELEQLCRYITRPAGPGHRSRDHVLAQQGDVETR